MKMKTLIAVAVAGAFAVPFAAQASVDNDRIILAQAGGAPGGASGGASPTAPSSGGAAAQGGTTSGQTGTGQPGTGSGLPPTDLQQLDANNDGYVSREEAARHQGLNSRFSEIDKDSDGRISKSEWDAAMGSAGTGATTGQSSDPARDTGTAASRPQPATGSSGSTTK